MGSPKIKLIVYDFDGVMTDNRVIVADDGHESVTCSRADGMGIALIKQFGIKQVIMTTETNTSACKRAEKLGIPIMYGVKDKRLELMDICTYENLARDEIVFVGNDVNDLQAMQFAGRSMCPSDAHPSIKAVATNILHTKGGHGVCREVADALIHEVGA